MLRPSSVVLPRDGAVHRPPKTHCPSTSLPGQELISVTLLSLWPSCSQFFPISTQNFLTLAPLRWITFCWDSGLFCALWMFSHIAVFYPLDASSIPLRIYDNQNISGHCQTFPRGAKLPLVENHSSRRQVHRNINTIILTTVAGVAPIWKVQNACEELDDTILFNICNQETSLCWLSKEIRILHVKRLELRDVR